MTAIDNRREPGSALCRLARIRGSIFALALVPLLSGSVDAHDVEVAKLLKAKGVEVKDAKGIITAITVPDGSQLTDDEFRQMTRLSHLKMLSLSKGLNDERLAQLTGLA